MAAKKTPSASRTRDAAAPKQRAAKGPRPRSASKKTADEVVTIDRRRAARREEEDESAAPVIERRAKVQRRRQIDPTTCERDYSVEEVEFMNAMDEYKRKSGRMFPTCSEVLEVIRTLGYVKVSPAGRAMMIAEMDEAEQAAAIESEEALPRL